MEYLTLNNGVKMPLEGFGVYQIPNLEEARKVTLDALDAGYRLIDTAAAYCNESAVGTAIRESGIPRDEIFLTTKVWVEDIGYEKTKKAVDVSLKKLGLDYVDLMLLHHPMADYFGGWRALEEAYKEGKIRAIGMANCYAAVLVDMWFTVDVKPAVNQVEMHPFYQRENDIAVMKMYGVAPQAWGPFAEGKNNIFSHPILTEIGRKYGKSAAQIALRWNVERGVSVIPKSVHRDRIDQNLNIWDFSLDKEDKLKIKALDSGRSLLMNHLDPDYIRRLHNTSYHDKR